MNETPKAAVELLTLPDDDYFAFDDEVVVDFQTRLSALRGGPQLPRPGAAPPPGLLAIGAPRRVDVTARELIPVLVAARWTGRRAWEVAYDQNACVTVIDLDSGALTLGRPFLVDKREGPADPSGTGTPPDPFNADAVAHSVRRFDLREIARLEWKPARLAVTAIVYDWVSNTVVVELRDPALPPPPEPEPPAPRAASEFLEPAAAGKPAPPGLTLTIPATAGAAGPIPVRGSVNLPKTGAVVLPGLPPATAPVLAATVVLLQLDERVPVLVDVAFPGAAAEPDRVAGSFGFDLRKATTEPLSGKYQAYLVAGAAVAGPYPLTVE